MKALRAMLDNIQPAMKKSFFFLGAAIMMITSCKLLHLGADRQEKNGCPTNGKNIGAEKLVTGNPKAIAAAKKAGKFKMDKRFLN